MTTDVNGLIRRTIGERQEALRRRLAAGHAAAAPELNRRRLLNLARGFMPNPRMESLLRLQADDPAAYGRLPATMRVAVGHYAEQKRAAEAATEDNGHA